MSTESACSEKITEAAIALLGTLKKRQLKIAFAESMSGGLLSGNLTRISGVSSVLLGSVVCYDKKSKIRLLGISENLLSQKGAESAEVTRAMAEGLPALFPEANVVVAITGSASSPVNDYRISSPEGRVFFCFGIPGQKLISEMRDLKGNRREVLDQAVLLALEFLREFSANAGKTT